MNVIATGLGFLEGPVICQDGSLVVTSLDLGQVFRITLHEVTHGTRGEISRDGPVYDPPSQHPAGVARVLATTGGGANGATEGPNGNIYVTQNGGTWPAINAVRSAPGVQVIEPDGAVNIFGTEMQSPNDLCFGPDGYLYVTDPARKPERDYGRIWRCDIRTRECETLIVCDWYPNGIGFSSDPHWIYVADSRGDRIVRFPLSDIRPATLETAIQLNHGKPDGFAFDAHGDLVIACPDLGPQGGDIQVYRGNTLQRALKPGTSKYYTNLAISADGWLYLCDADRGQVLAERWGCAGLPLYPFRSSPGVAS